MLTLSVFRASISMRVPFLLGVLATASLAAARSTRHVGKKDFQKPAAKLEARQPLQPEFPQYSQRQNQKRQSSYLNSNSQSKDASSTLSPGFLFS